MFFVNGEWFKIKGGGAVLTMDSSGLIKVDTNMGSMVYPLGEKTPLGWVWGIKDKNKPFGLVDQVNQFLDKGNVEDPNGALSNSLKSCP